MRIKRNLSQIRAEVLLHYLYPEMESQWIAINKGTFSQFSKAITPIHSHLSTFKKGISLAFSSNQLSALLCSIIAAAPLQEKPALLLIHQFVPSPHLLSLCTTHTPPLRVFRDLQVWGGVHIRPHQ